MGCAVVLSFVTLFIASRNGVVSDSLKADTGFTVRVLVTVTLAVLKLVEESKLFITHFS